MLGASTLLAGLLLLRVELVSAQAPAPHNVTLPCIDASPATVSQVRDNYPQQYAHYSIQSCADVVDYHLCEIQVASNLCPASCGLCSSEEGQPHWRRLAASPSAKPPPSPPPPAFIPTGVVCDPNGDCVTPIIKCQVYIGFAPAAPPPWWSNLPGTGKVSFEHRREKSCEPAS